MKYQLEGDIESLIPYGSVVGLIRSDMICSNNAIGALISVIMLTLLYFKNLLNENE